LKLSTLYKAQGHEVRFVRGLHLVTRFIPDEIKVTSLFTWAWRPVWEAVGFYRALFPMARISLGGIYATLMPEHAAGCGADDLFKGIEKGAEDLMPDYALVPDWHRHRAASIVFASRGCIRKCDFCAVPRLEGKPFQMRATTRIKHLVHPDHKRVIFWDNNILGESHWPEVFEEIYELGLEVDFNQGLDARLISEHVAHELKRLKLPTIRMAYDFIGMRKSIQRAIINLRGAGVAGNRMKHVCCYVLYNHRDTPHDLFERVRDLLAWGVAAYPMRFQPLSGEDALEKDSYVAPNWTAEQLDMVAAARRVIGYGGAFPSYEGLVKKFANAQGFDDAFGLRPRSDGKKRALVARRKPKDSGFELREFAWDLINMGRDHQFPVHALGACSVGGDSVATRPVLAVSA
jgi:hypothetical protein